ncbi:methyltransferase domain-containing protein [Brachyspira pilosicoli]|uniref:methyltransferase domain-containing protein n=1 Tax=Brachyspira pilosicoli TaxID=52584 RepID=UPI003003B84F
MNKKNEEYTKDFWDSIRKLNYNSACIILKMLFKYYRPISMIDIGCGIGTWLKAACELGIEEVFGLDFNELNESELMVPRKLIGIVDLEKHINTNNKKYDLAISLEVGEHLDYKYSKNFVDMITSYSNIILFSAAIPFQGGIHHVNCQPPYFWAELFKNNNYVCFDPFRWRLMEFNEVEMNPFYAQNMLLYVHSNNIDSFLSHGLKICDKPIFFYHPTLVSNKEKKISTLNSQFINSKNIINKYKIDVSNYISLIEKMKIDINWFNFLTLFAISNNDEYVRIILFGIKFTFRVNENSINKIAWWIPVKKWRESFRAKFKIRPDQTRPDQTRPDQTRNK